MSIMDGRSIALNVAARTTGIPTLVLDHGIRVALEEYWQLYQSRSTKPERISPIAGGRSAIAFVAASLSWRNAPQIPLIGAHFLLRPLEGGLAPVRHLRGEYRRPDRYLAFTDRNANYWRDICQARDDEIECIGIPEFDAFFRHLPSEESVSRSYDLLIDSPVGGAQGGYVPVREMVAMFRRLGDRLQSDGLRLKVKLHPERFEQTWFPEHPAIDWIREARIEPLIRGCRNCYSFRSTLMLPAAALRPLCVIDIGVPMAQVDHLVSLGVVHRLPIESVGSTVPPFDELRRAGTGWNQFVRDYLYATDGRSTERLANALLQPLPLRRRMNTWPLALRSPRHQYRG